MGSIALDRFRIEERLGAGGFGTVYRAWDERLEREVAVKVIEAPGRAGERVLREAQAAARLNHRGIVALYELGEQDGRAYLVSELVDGPTLRECAARGELSDRRIAEIGVELAGALEHAHARGVVHRDVKPDNVLVCDNGSAAKLMDFGVARVLDAAALTASGEVVGTLAYMAPEQAEGREAVLATDVYALALTLYEAWSGENPNRRATPAATARAIGGPLPSLGDLRPDLPAELCETVDAALDPEPGLRPAPRDVAWALKRALPQLGDRALSPLDDGAAHGLHLPRPGPATAAAAAAVAALSAAAMAAAGPAGPLWAYLLVPLAGALTLLRPRVGYLLAVLGLAAWLSAAAQQPGAAALVILAGTPAALLLGGEGRLLTLPALAPLLAALGAAPLYPLVAAAAPRGRDRLTLGLLGFGWLALAEATSGRDLFLAAPQAAGDAWAGSVGAALTDVVLPLATSATVVATIAAAGVAAVVIGALVGPLLAAAPRRRQRRPRPLGEAFSQPGRQATLP